MQICIKDAYKNVLYEKLHKLVEILKLYQYHTH